MARFEGPELGFWKYDQTKREILFDDEVEYLVDFILWNDAADSGFRNVIGPCRGGQIRALGQHPHLGPRLLRDFTRISMVVAHGSCPERPTGLNLVVLEEQRCGHDRVVPVFQVDVVHAFPALSPTARASQGDEETQTRE